MTAWRELQPVRVRAPGSTSNLGAGFDCLGLALRRYLHASYTPGPTPLRVDYRGTLRGLELPPGRDLSARAFLAELERRGGGATGGVIVLDSEIPLARGLGSSGAAIVAGQALAAGAAGERALTHHRLLDAAVALEGHPDNVAASLCGGLVAIYRAVQGGSRALRLPLSDQLVFAYAAPGMALSTSQARAALPLTVAHASAARQVSRMAALLHGLATGDEAALRAGFEGELHVPYRLPLIPGGAAALGVAHEAGALAATISGSGSGLIAACRPEHVARVAEAMAAAFRREAGEEGVVAFEALPDFAGAVIEGGPA
ncbi:MAG: homoserine kinase [Longimicrobiales bacterium]